MVEEAAFRGYMQRGLERFGSGTAIVVTSIVFALVHGVHGWQMLLLLGPGIFIASVLYGLLAYHSGSILPGMAGPFPWRPVLHLFRGARRRLAAPDRSLTAAAAVPHSAGR